MSRVKYIGPIMLDEPEKFDFDEFVRQAVALEAERLFYYNGKLYLIDYDTLHGIVGDEFIVVEIITYASFSEVGEFRGWVVYYGNDDIADYVSKIKDIRGDMTIIPVIRTADRFIRKIEESINKNRFIDFAGGKSQRRF
ncbi:MAG: hypothetical protein QFX40_05495 [Archaeoglobales archaeon]|nr:hypothetical protein [Archaeoglobales archaeon]